MAIITIIAGKQGILLKVDTMKHVELDQVQAELANLIKQALQGEEVVITQSERPVLRLVRIPASPPRRKRGSAKGQIKIAPDFDAPLEDFKAYME